MLVDRRCGSSNVHRNERLDLWPDTSRMLQQFKRAGLILAPLSNYTPMMIENLLENGGVRDYFDDTVVRRSVEEHRAGKADHGELLWALVNFELWLRGVVAAPLRDARMGAAGLECRSS